MDKACKNIFYIDWNLESNKNAPKPKYQLYDWKQNLVNTLNDKKWIKYAI